MVRELREMKMDARDFNKLLDDRDAAYLAFHEGGLAEELWTRFEEASDKVYAALREVRKTNPLLADSFDGLNGRQTMNSRSQRVLNDPGPELVAPLSGPWRSWRKPLPAIIADTMANSRALLSRLDRGMYMPDYEPQYREPFNELYRRTKEQIAALETFSQIEWRE